MEGQAKDSKKLTVFILRPFMILTGWSFVALAALGVFLPLLPTTPFLLLAAACFARSSPRFHQWLLNSHLFGPIIKNWKETRTIPLRAKIISIILILLVGGSSVFFALDRLDLRILVSILLAIPIAFLCRLKSTESLHIKKPESD